MVRRVRSSGQSTRALSRVGFVLALVAAAIVGAGIHALLSKTGAPNSAPSVQTSTVRDPDVAKSPVVEPAVSSRRDVDVAAAAPEPVVEVDETESILARMSAGEAARLGNEDPRHFVEYVQLQRVKQARLWRSLPSAYLVVTGGDPEVALKRSVERHVRGGLDAKTRAEALAVLKTFSDELISLQKRIDTKYAIYPITWKTYAQGTEHTAREIESFDDIDSLFGELDPELQLVGIFGPLPAGERYLDLKDFQ
jgi:hypothetical protein